MIQTFSGGSGGMTHNHNLIYDHERGHWYKTHPLFATSTKFETLSCIVDKRLPRVIVLGKTADEIKLIVLKVGNYQNWLHLQPMKTVTIGEGLMDGVLFALGTGKKFESKTPLSPVDLISVLIKSRSTDCWG